MPCNCDHMEPSEHEAESQRVAAHLVYIHARLKDLTPHEMYAYTRIANSMYGNALAVHQLTSELCNVMGNLSENDLNKYVYNGRIINTVDDLVSSLLYYDRKEDEDLPRGKIEEAVKDGVITPEEIVKFFKVKLYMGLFPK